MWRILFLTLILFSSISLAQTQDKPKAIKFDEYQSINNKNLKIKYGNFISELEKNISNRGVFIVYGNPKLRRTRISQLLDVIGLNCFPTVRTTFIEGGKSKFPKTEFWILPTDAELPNPMQK